MSWDIKLVDPVTNKPYQVPTFHEGGTQAIDGCSVSYLNVTYNYSQVTWIFGFRFSDLEERVAQDTIPELRNVVEKCGTTQYRDYWAPTPGNAGYAANILLGWAEAHPEGVWHVL